MFFWKGRDMRRAALLGLLVGVLVLGLVAVAQAATSQDIYNDYAQDRDLDGTYTDAELQAYLNDATIHMYAPGPITSALDKLVRKRLTSRGDFPFTGFEITLMLAGAALLVGGGVVIRRKYA